MSPTANALPPLISVIGETGTGKSNLAVDLARALNGEVINADAMQMYEGLPIITNKITPAEAKGVPHHLIGFLNVRDAWKVGDFVKEAERIIDDIRTRGKLPIIVGGTHYYVQSLLFPYSTPTETPSAEGDGDPSSKEQLEEKYPILTSPTPDLYAHLQSIDPLIASRWHPNDRRKILRSLKIYYASGCTRTASEVYASQRAHRNTPTGVASWTRYRNLIFWVHAAPSVLKARLGARVDKMITGGMWPEIEEMKQTYDAIRLRNASVGRPETTRREERGEDDEVDLGSGIWQSIGFKEFLPYLQRRDYFSSTPLGITPALGSAVEADKDEARISTEEATRELEKLREIAIADMKTATRQYAKTQTSWIRIKFMNALQPTNSSTKNGDIFLLDSTNIAKFSEDVSAKGVELAQDFLLNKPLPDPFTLSHLASTSLPAKRNYDFAHRPDLWAQRVCGLCKVTCINDDQWGLHEQGQRHKRTVRREERRPMVEALIKMRKEVDAKKAEVPSETEKA